MIRNGRSKQKGASLCGEALFLWSDFPEGRTPTTRALVAVREGLGALRSGAAGVVAPRRAYSPRSRARQYPLPCLVLKGLTEQADFS